jgi:hypothetical protein
VTVSPLAAFFINGAALFALGAGLAAVPILIHLLNRRRVQHVPWAAMQWLLAAMRRHQRRLRLENWLILLLRVLAILLLGLALARPVLTSPDVAGLVAGKRSVYLVVDTSYSMGAKTGAQTVADVAKAEADAVLTGLGPKDTVAVVSTNDPRLEQSDGRAPFTVTPRVVGKEGADKAKEAVAALKLRDAPAAWPEALDLVLEQMAPEDVNRLVVIVTDFQDRDWSPARRGPAEGEGEVPAGRHALGERLVTLLAQGAAVRIVNVGGTSRRNLTLSRIGTPSRRDVFVGRPFRLAVTVTNHGPEPVDGAHLTVTLDGSPSPLARRSVPRLAPVDPTTGGVPKDAEATVLFDLAGSHFADAGAHALEVTVSPPGADAGADGLALDSRRAFAVRVRDRIRVVAWTAASRDARDAGAQAYLEGVFERFGLDDAGQPVERNPLYDLEVVDRDSALIDALRGRRGAVPDLLVLANVAPRGTAAETLRSYVRGGGALLVFVGDRIADPDALNGPFHDDPAYRLLPFPFQRPEVHPPGSAPPFRIDLERDTGHPLARPFTGEDAALWMAEATPQAWGRLGLLEAPPSPTPGGPGPDGGRPPGPPLDPEGRVVLRWTDGTPAVVEGAFGTGKSLWVGTSLDWGWFERTLPFFLPVFLDDAAVYLTRPDEARRNLEVGRRIVVNWLPRDFRDALFVAPGGMEFVPARYEGDAEGDAATLIQDRVGTAGVWELRFSREGGHREAGAGAPRRSERFAVNPNPAEGALRAANATDLLGRLPAESDVQVITSWSEKVAESRRAEQGEVSRLLLWIAFGILALESLLAWLVGRASTPAGGAPPPVPAEA